MAASLVHELRRPGSMKGAKVTLYTDSNCEWFIEPSEIYAIISDCDSFGSKAAIYFTWGRQRPPFLLEFCFFEEKSLVKLTHRLGSFFYEDTFADVPEVRRRLAAFFDNGDSPLRELLDATRPIVHLSQEEAEAALAKLAEADKVRREAEAKRERDERRAATLKELEEAREENRKALEMCRTEKEAYKGFHREVFFAYHDIAMYWVDRGLKNHDGDRKILEAVRKLTEESAWNGYLNRI